MVNNMSELNKSMSEVYAIFSNMTDELKSKIPEKVKQFIRKNRDYDYLPKINKTQNLKEQQLMPQTRSLLAVYYLLYLCKSNEEKQEIINNLKKNK